MSAQSLSLPVVPMRNAVLFPGVTFPDLGRSRRRRCARIEAALNDAGAARLRRRAARTTPRTSSPPDLYTIGTIATLGSVQRGLGGIRLVLEGKARGIALRVSRPRTATSRRRSRTPARCCRSTRSDAAFVALHREVRERAAELGKKRGLPDEVVEQILAEVDEPGRLADLVAGYLDVPVAEKQALLETLSVEDRLRRVLVHVQRQIDVLAAQEDIQSKVKEELGGRQREMYLREQMKAIQKELGEGDGGRRRRPEGAAREARRARPARGRAQGSRPRVGAPDAHRPRVDGVAGHPHLPRDDRGAAVEHAQRRAARRRRRRRSVLDEDHYGLEDVKDRILEFLAVRQLAHAAGQGGRREGREAEKKADARRRASPEPDADKDDDEPSRARRKGRILLFAGPPGVGKTSIAKSIARAMGRKYVRISLGGARDEADIRGHRRTYIGAMPGRILQGMKQAGTKNPVFLLDEVDKLGVSYQGDPASALLEVLDPAQNDSFTDHYLGVPFDLSEVLFIATANFLQNIPGPLLDRMEVVEFAGYTEHEKLEIAKSYLVPRQLEENGLDGRRSSTLTDDAIREVITSYTRESGVRQLERELGQLARKVARRIAAREIESADGRPRGRARAARPAARPSGEDGRARTRSASRPACTTRRPAATSCSSRRR